MKMTLGLMLRGVDMIILSTYDEKTSAALVQRAIDKGIAVVLVNSDIKSFPTGVNSVVGYGQSNGMKALSDYIAKKVNGKANVGVLEGQPGWHSTEHFGGDIVLAVGLEMGRLNLGQSCSLVFRRLVSQSAEEN